jgi:hypothetical protein
MCFSFLFVSQSLVECSNADQDYEAIFRREHGAQAAQQKALGYCGDVGFITGLGLAISLGLLTDLDFVNGLGLATDFDLRCCLQLGLVRFDVTTSSTRTAAPPCCSTTTQI